MIQLNNIRARLGATKANKRLGRGNGTGHGKTGGKGGKGQTARSGGRVRPGFEGGQNPMYRRLPKRGFTNLGARFEFVVQLGDLESFGIDQISIETLKGAGIAPRKSERLAVIGNGKIAKKLKLGAFRVSAASRKAIETAGGEVALVGEIFRK